jgi:dipeptidyl aminopeptidase/acylaminoacyl peptidase
MYKFALLLSLGSAASATDVMLMNRIGPARSELYVANADGSAEHKLLNSSAFDYHASYSYDGKWTVFTSERSGYGQADIYRVHPDGTSLERLTDDPALDDQGALSPDGSQVAFVSTRITNRANIWILDLKTKQFRNLLGLAQVVRGWQPDRVLRNPNREHMGCARLRTQCQSDFTDCIYRSGDRKAHGGDIRAGP